MTRPRVAISACLYGDAVRYDGADKRQSELLRELGPHVEWVPVCPEVGAGYGTPREPIHVERRGDALRLITNATARDVTEPMHAFIEREIERLRELGIVAYVFKARSPSCGVRDTPVFEDGEARELDAGLFARAVRERLPEVHLVDESEVADADARRRFLELVGA